MPITRSNIKLGCASLILVTIIIGFSGCVYWLKKSEFGKFGTDLTISKAIVTKENWPFKISPNPSFNDLYVRIIGFQDTTYYMAFSGRPDEIKEFSKNLEKYKDLEYKETKEISDIVDVNSGLLSLDKDYRVHGWLLGSDSGYYVMGSVKKQMVVFISSDWSRLYYHSYTM